MELQRKKGARKRKKMRFGGECGGTPGSSPGRNSQSEIEAGSMQTASSSTPSEGITPMAWIPEPQGLKPFPRNDTANLGDGWFWITGLRLLAHASRDDMVWVPGPLPVPPRLAEDQPMAKQSPGPGMAKASFPRGLGVHPQEGRNSPSLKR